MKINEKSLSKYAGSGAPPDKEGSLQKRGDFNKGFQKRWFVLKGNLLFYYDKKIDKDPIGVIILEGCTVELSDHEDGFTFMIHFPGANSRTYILCADTQEDMEAWMKALSGASYDYVKLCVSELKKQLHDFETDGSVGNMAALLTSSLDRTSNSSASSSSQDKPDGAAMSRSGEGKYKRLGTTRHNPFGDSVDRESVIDRQTMVAKQARTFLQMHQELFQQITELTQHWLDTHPFSKTSLPVETPRS